MLRVARVVRDVRRRAGLSQTALAARARTSQPAIARYEAGTATPSLRTLERICAACGASLQLHISGRGKRADRRSKLLDHIRRSRDRLLAAARGNGVRDLRVFGSVARGSDTPGSDVDFLVELEPGRTLLDLIGFQQDAEDILGRRVDVAMPRLLKERVRARALREARPV